ncbi:hypothetical protein [Actinomadura sp. HBU206391]|uniref:hypothetical protein n=1 Tax=Actinomadura sp. HBU206391 TaxID=2731692 RepID=UPI0016507680|nr:hypothetical protein [Actinomadura sp. HBU206391]MBC6458446.1 hypothetical protein [Actinomadura sp. HBU206391]
MSTAKRTARVHSYTRRDGTRVRSHNRAMSEWKQAGAAWAATAGSGATTLALVTQLGLALISTLAIVLTLLLATLATHLTEKASKPRRTMRAKTRPRSRTTASRSRSSAARKRRR